MIILLNGPARSGKDTVAQFIKKHGYQWQEMKISAPLKRAVPALFSLSHEVMKALEESKDDPAYILFGKSYREVQIAISEQLLKPMYGDDIFGRLFVNATRQVAHPNIVVSDAGFNCEIEPILSAFPRSMVGLIHIERPGYTFEGDSREWLDPTPFQHYQKINNQFDLEMLEEQTKRAMRKWHLLKDK